MFTLKPRRKSHSMKIGHVSMGGDAPVIVQSMTNTDTADIEGTVAQIIALAEAGSEIVRITVNNEAAPKPCPLSASSSMRALPCAAGG